MTFRLEFFSIITSATAGEYALLSEDRRQAVKAERRSHAYLDLLYRNETYYAPGADLYYQHGPFLPAREVVITPERWRLLARYMSDHFLGVSVAEVRDAPEAFLDLPLAPLVLFAAGNLLFPPTMMPRVVADIHNIASDGLGDDFMVRLEQDYPQSGLPDIWESWKSALVSTEGVKGSFRITM